jgi:hypothetical protein
MVCESCVQKLARKLAEHHRIDWINALVLAEKAVERVERRGFKSRPCCQKRRQKLGRIFGLPVQLLSKVNIRATLLWSWRLRRLSWVLRGYNPDYTLACTLTGSVTCYGVLVHCTTDEDCLNTYSCQCQCPSPLPHSHNVSLCTVTSVPDCPCSQTAHRCGLVGSCSACNGTCGYDCDSGYTWNGIQCVSAAVAKKYLGDGLIFVGY